MKKHHLILAWLLLLIPTGVVGGIALRLLVNEQRNIAMTAMAAAMQHAQAVANTIEGLITEVKADLLQSMQDISVGPRRLDRLKEWEQSNPLVRNVFAIQLPNRVISPNPNQPANDEEAEFLERYEPLFSGRVPWSDPELDISQTKMRTETNDEWSSRYQTRRLMLRKMTQKGAKQASPYSTVQPTGTSVESGWFPWTWENRPHALGWVDNEGMRYGLELETVALISLLVGMLPESGYKDGVLALLDPGGHITYQRGAEIIQSDTPKLASVQIGSALPNWQISIYAPHRNTTRVSQRAMILLTGCMVATFTAAILLGGSLLLWQAHAHLRDAKQKTSFVSNVSHELKTPLTTIRMYAELLAENRVREEAKRTRYVQVIIDESRRLTRLVNNVLDFSRLEQGKKQYHPESLNLVQMIREILDAQRPRIEQAGMVLQKNVDHSPIFVNMDRDTLEQVVLNLIDNAMKYASTGNELTVCVGAEKSIPTVQILDRGPGIPPCHRHRIFEKFHRVDDSLTATQPGSGLGLSIAQRQMRDLGGDLTYSPRANGGSCFTVCFPVQGDAEP